MLFRVVLLDRRRYPVEIYISFVLHTSELINKGEKMGMGKIGVTHSFTKSLRVTFVVLLLYDVIHVKEN